MTASQLNFREPKVLVRGVLGLLLLANLVVAAFAFHVFGDSPTQLDSDLESARIAFRAAQQHLNRTKTLVHNMDTSREQGNRFLASYMTPRRREFLTVGKEINTLAESSGMKVGDLNFSNPELIENSNDLSMMNITANFDGPYAALVKFVNLLDRSPKFLMIESLQVAPQPKGDVLNTTIKMTTFIRDNEGAGQ